MNELRNSTLIFLVKKTDGEIHHVCLAMKKRGFGINRWNGVGGKVDEQNETIEEAATREAKEEIFVNVNVKDLSKVAELSFSFPHNPSWDQSVHVWEGGASTRATTNTAETTERTRSRHRKRSEFYVGYCLSKPHQRHTLPPMSPWSVYILRCRDGSLYTGISTDVDARVKLHNAGKGAAYTRSHRPVTLVWSERAKSESAVRKREAQIKGLTRVKKENLIRYGHPNGLGN